MTTSKCLVMMGGESFRLMAVKDDIPPPPPPRDLEAEKEMARLVAEAKSSFDAALEREQKKQKQRCAACAVQLDDCIRGMKEEIEQQVVAMGLRLAEIVLRHQLPDREMLGVLIRETLSPISDLRGVRVRMSSSDVAIMKSPAPGQLPPPPFLDQVELVPDPALMAGDLLVESRNGIFDGRLNERLATLADKLKERVRQPDANAATQPI